jgi:uncharacterized protein YjbI with pentapeptide repeats
MDHGSFDKLARLLGAAGSRRAALGALLGTGLAGAIAGAEAAKKDRTKKRRNGKKGRNKSQVSAQAADCLSPGHGSNISGCDYTNANFSGQDLSSSRMVGTIFRNAELVETDLSSSNAKDANFRGANLCGADLSSSTLRNADFRGFAPPGRQTNLAFADLSSSACGGLLTNNRTFICGTTWCDGTIRNDSCTGGVPGDLCCTPCGAGEACIDNECVAVCDEVQTVPSCACKNAWDDGSGGAPVCVNNFGVCGAQTCASDADCGGGGVCIFTTCCPEQGRCAPPCPSLGDCACPPVVTACDSATVCGDLAAAARRSSRGSAGLEFAP